MAGGTYTGALVRRSNTYAVSAGKGPPGVSDVHATNPNPPSVYDTAVDMPSQDVGTLAFSASPEVVGSQWLHTVGFGGLVDQANTTDHAVMGPHSLDTGTADAQYAAAVDGVYDYTYRAQTDYTQGSDSPQQVSAESLVRGMNADPANNPDGIPRGRRLHWWSDRKIPFPAEREHDQRVVRRTLAAQPGNQTPLRGPSPYGGSFLGSLQVPFERLLAQPATRRQPAPLSETMPLSDATTASPVVGGRWL